MNILLVTVDSLRYDRVTTAKMPHTHSFAASNLEFSRCFANGPSTPASFPAIHASRYFASINGLGIPKDGDVVTTAEVMRNGGYRTAGFTDNHFASGSYNFDRGFETMVDAGGRSESGRIKQFVQSNLDKQGFLFRSIERVYSSVDSFVSPITGKESEYVRAAELNDRALEWVDELTEKWFLWLHYMDAHHPYEPPPSYRDEFLNEDIGIAECRRLSRKGTHHPDDMTASEWQTIENLYDAECAYVDDQFNALLSSLADRGILDETVVCFTADHGELVGEHNHAGHPPKFWEGIIRVPLVLGNVGLTGTVDEQVCLLDIPPTLAESAELKGSDNWQGKSVIPVATGESDGHMHVFGDIGREVDYRRGFVRRADGWKLLRHGGDEELLFNVDETPAERLADNQRDEATEIHRELSEQLDRHCERMRALREGVSGVQADDEMVEEHLRDLGYL